MRALEPVEDPTSVGLRCEVCGGNARKGSIFYVCDDVKTSVISGEDGKKTIETSACTVTTCDAMGCIAGHEATHAKERARAEAEVPPHQRLRVET